MATRTFNWRLTTAAAPSVIVQSAQTTVASNIFDHLTPGVAYNVEANAVGSAGPVIGAIPCR
jgi:hypothetical protein